MRPCNPVLFVLVSLAVFAATPAAIADATSKVPEKFKSDTYIEADYEDFCTGQSSGRACIEVTIKNSSMSVVDIRDNSLDGSLSGTGALEAFQVFEAQGCVKRYQLSADVRAHLGPDETYSRTHAPGKSALLERRAPQDDQGAQGMHICHRREAGEGRP